MTANNNLTQVKTVLSRGHPRFPAVVRVRTYKFIHLPTKGLREPILKPLEL